MKSPCRCAAAAALLLAVALGGCFNPPPVAPVKYYKVTPSENGTPYIVQPGDTVYSIARTHGLDSRAIRDANPVLNQRDLLVGETLMIPTPGAGGLHPTEPPHVGIRSPGHPGPIPAEARFIWPVRGDIVSRFRQPASGVDIRVRPGAEVVAAKSGRVNVFTSAPEYGQVIVLEHEDGSASYYGRLGEILVAHGTWVKQGEVIATVADRASGSELQFRIMENERFVDPLPLLSR